MAEKIPPDQLEETIKKLGVDDKTARAMRKANVEPDEGDAKPARRRGFGAPAQDTTPLPSGI